MASLAIGKSSSALIPMPDGTSRFRRVVKWNRFPSQRAFDELGSKYKGFSGPIGSGKSKALVHEAIKCAYLNPGCMGLLGAPTYKMLTNSTLREMLGSLEEHGIPHTVREGGLRIHLPEPNSTIVGLTLQEPERLRAMNLGWFGVDELSYCSEDAWTRLEGRLRDPRARLKRGFAVWTPKGRDWVWRKWISARKVAHYSCIQARPFENRAILDATPDFYENLKGAYDEKFYRQEVLGEYVDMFSGAVYHSFHADNLRKLDFNPALPLIWSLDFNLSPMTAVLCQVSEHYGYKTVLVLKEIVLNGANVPEICREFVRRTRPWQEQLGRDMLVHVYGDATGSGGHASTGDSSWTVLQRFMRAQEGYELRYLYGRGNPTHPDRANAVNAMLCSFGDGHRAAGERHLYIDPSCKELITDFEDVKWKVDAHGNTYPEIDKNDPKRTHISDALGYYIEREHGFRSKGRAIRESL